MGSTPTCDSSLNLVSLASLQDSTFPEGDGIKPLLPAAAGRLCVLMLSGTGVEPATPSSKGLCSNQTELIATNQDVRPTAAPVTFDLQNTAHLMSFGCPLLDRLSGSRRNPQPIKLQTALVYPLGLIHYPLPSGYRGVDQGVRFHPPFASLQFRLPAGKRGYLPCTSSSLEPDDRSVNGLVCLLCPCGWGYVGLAPFPWLPMVIPVSGVIQKFKTGQCSKPTSYLRTAALPLELRSVRSRTLHTVCALVNKVTFTGCKEHSTQPEHVRVCRTLSFFSSATLRADISIVVVTVSVIHPLVVTYQLQGLDSLVIQLHLLLRFVATVYQVLDTIIHLSTP